MELSKPEYRKRPIDDKVMGFLNIFGVVSISGSKWCGKTCASLRS